MASATPLPPPGVATQEAFSAFMVMVSGQIETGDFPEFDSLYVKVNFVYGQDWTVTAGVEEGVSQTARKSAGSHSRFVWNFPLELTLRSSSPHGWPQIVISVYGLDGLGRDVVRGYGALPLPVCPGAHSCRVPVFVPQASSSLQQIVSWVLGQRPEFVDAKFVARGVGREGHVTLAVHILTKDLARLGYRTAAATATATPGSA